METPFSDRTHQTLKLAEQEAGRLNDEYVGTAHLLLALLADGVIAKVLENLGVRTQAIKHDIDRLLNAGPAQPSVVAAHIPLPYTPRVEGAIERAAEQAQPDKDGGRLIEPEDLMIGLLRDTDNVPAQVLMNHGLKLQTLRDEIVKSRAAP